MIFDLKSGKRRRVVQVVFGVLAFIFFMSFVGFGVGSGNGAGGLFDALGIGGSSNSSDPQYDQQISDAQDAVKANPTDGNAYADLITAYYQSASSGDQPRPADRPAVDLRRRPLRPREGRARPGPTTSRPSRTRSASSRHPRRPGLHPAQRRRERRRGPARRRRLAEDRLRPTPSWSSTSTPTGKIDAGDKAAKQADRRRADRTERSRCRSDRRHCESRRSSSSISSSSQQAQQQAAGRHRRAGGSSTTRSAASAARPPAGGTVTPTP